MRLKTVFKIVGLSAALATPFALVGCDDDDDKPKLDGGPTDAPTSDVKASDTNPSVDTNKLDTNKLDTNKLDTNVDTMGDTQRPDTTPVG